MNYRVKTFCKVRDFEDFLNTECIDKENIVDITMNHGIILLVYIVEKSK